MTLTMNTKTGWDWDRALQAMPNRWTEVAEELFPFASELHKNDCHRVYDLGCGVGRHTLFLAQQGFTVTASDVSPSAIVHTRENLERRELKAELHELDMSDWPFESASFDAIVAFNVVYHSTADKLEAVLAEIYRTLTPNGLLFVTFKSVQDSDYGQGEKLADFTYAPTSGIETGIAHYYIDEDELRRLMQNFELISLIHKQEFPVSAKSERQRAHWVVWARKPDRNGDL